MLAVLIHPSLLANTVAVPVPSATLLLTFLVGLVIPALVALVTKENLPQWAKTLILTLLSVVAGTLAGLVSTPPSTWAQWKLVLVSIAVAFVGAATSGHLWQPALASIARATRAFGIGKKASTPAGLKVPMLRIPLFLEVDQVHAGAPLQNGDTFQVPLQATHGTIVQEDGTVLMEITF